MITHLNTTQKRSIYPVLGLTMPMTMFNGDDLARDSGDDFNDGDDDDNNII